MNRVLYSILLLFMSSTVHADSGSTCQAQPEVIKSKLSQISARVSEVYRENQTAIQVADQVVHDMEKGFNTTPPLSVFDKAKQAENIEKNRFECDGQTLAGMITVYVDGLCRFEEVFHHCQTSQEATYINYSALNHADGNSQMLETQRKFIKDMTTIERGLATKNSFCSQAVRDMKERGCASAYDKAMYGIIDTENNLTMVEWVAKSCKSTDGNVSGDKMVNELVAALEPYMNEKAEKMCEIYDVHMSSLKALREVRNRKNVAVNNVNCNDGDDKTTCLAGTD